MILRSAGERFGSAGFSTISDLKEAKLLNNGGLHHGFTFERHPIQIGFDADTPSLIIGAAGSGKLATHLAYQTLQNGTLKKGILQNEATVYVDPKGEIAAIANLNPFIKQYYFNPYRLHTDAPWLIPDNHCFNVLDILTDSPFLFDDATVIAKNLIDKPAGGSGTSMHFYNKAVQVVSALLVYLRTNNKNASLPDLYNLVGDITAGGENNFFVKLHYPKMMASNYSAVQQVAEELMSKLNMGATSEFSGIMSSISTALQCLGSPVLQSALSGQSTISFKDFIKPDSVKKLFIMIPVHLIDNCASIIRCMIAALSIEQQRSPLGRIHFCIDEAGQLGHFEALERMFSYGRGSKARVSAYFQNSGQLVKNYGKDGADTLISNAQSKLILGVASYDSAKFVCDNILGQSTYRYISQDKASNAAFKRAQAFQQALNGGELGKSLLDIAKHSSEMHRPEAVARQLLTLNEVMHLPNDMGILDINGIGINPYLYFKWPYFLNKAVAHRFLPNPFHLPFDKIFIPASFGRMKAVNIITEPVPESISQLPQYESGYWSYPENFNPLKQKRFGIF